MFKFYKNWKQARRNKKLQHPVIRAIRLDLGAELCARLEYTGIDDNHYRNRIYKDLGTGRYWISEYAENDVGSYELFTSLDHETAQAIVQFPEMLAQFGRTGKWVKPNNFPLQ